ncbi:hypothetical protein ACH9DO_00125 [Kocuria sp. M1N1S27]|uniref:hypothetical protein n=1 Tax=Kocuria kalidii TaxID=3376283 RepID=UPI00378B7360
MLTARDRLLLGLWLLPVGLGLVVGTRVGDDDGSVMLFVTGVVAALYAVVLVRVLLDVRRRRRWARMASAAGVVPPAPVDPDPERPDTDGERGHVLAVSRVLQLVLVVSGAVYVVAEAGWTFVVVAAQLVTVVTMAAYVHERGAEPVG